MRNLSIWLFLALSIAGSQLSAVTIVCQAGAAEYRVNDDVPGGILNLRTGPGVNHDLVVSSPSGSTGVEVTECRSGDDDVSKKSWCRATWKGNHGWVSSCCISQTQNNSLSHSSVIASLAIISEYSRQKSCSKTDTRTVRKPESTMSQTRCGLKMIDCICQDTVGSMISRQTTSGPLTASIQPISHVTNTKTNPTTCDIH
jgi:uncharacterized protein YraI